MVLRLRELGLMDECDMGMGRMTISSVFLAAPCRIVPDAWYGMYHYQMHLVSKRQSSPPNGGGNIPLSKFLVLPRGQSFDWSF